MDRDPARSSLTAMARVHIVGSGLAGLAAAVRLVLQGRQVALYEAAGFELSRLVPAASMEFVIEGVPA